MDYKEEMDKAYGERNQLVAVLSKLYPSSLELHDKNDPWEEDWRWIVFIDFPTGQICYHIHDSELPNFDHLPRHQGRQWDGHSKDERARRLAAFSKTK